jgi:hypothetical protein
MIRTSRDLFKEALRAVFSEQGWHESVCTRCGETFFAASPARNCRAPGCCSPRPDRRSLAEVEAVDPLTTVWELIRGWFARHNFRHAVRTKLINEIGETYFVGAGLQIFDLVVHREVSYDEEVRFVPQPAVRLNYLAEAGAREGISTAFVNLCTEQISSQPEVAYQHHLTLWLGVLEAIGLSSAEISVTLNSKLWEEGIFRGWSAVFHYAGIELGDGILIFHAPQRSRAPISIVDFSFGLERLVWASSPDASYFDVLSPPWGRALGDGIELDRVRTGTLLVANGVMPSSRSHGRLLRSLLRRCTLAVGDAISLVDHAFDFWGRFLPPIVPVERCREIILDELRRGVNREIGRLLGCCIHPGKELVRSPPLEVLRTLAAHRASGAAATVPLRNRRDGLLLVPGSGVESASDCAQAEVDLLRLLLVDEWLPDGTIIDLGGDSDAFCLAAAERLPNWRIVTVESDPERARWLRLNAWVNCAVNLQVVGARVVGERNDTSSRGGSEPLSLDEILRLFAVKRLDLLCARTEYAFAVLSLASPVLLSRARMVLYRSHREEGEDEPCLTTAGFRCSRRRDNIGRIWTIAVNASVEEN